MKVLGKNLPRLMVLVAGVCLLASACKIQSPDSEQKWGKALRKATKATDVSDEVAGIMAKSKGDLLAMGESDLDRLTILFTVNRVATTTAIVKSLVEQINKTDELVKTFKQASAKMSMVDGIGRKVYDDLSNALDELEMKLVNNQILADSLAIGDPYVYKDVTSGISGQLGTKQLVEWRKSLEDTTRFSPVLKEVGMKDFKEITMKNRLIFSHVYNRISELEKAKKSIDSIPYNKKAVALTLADVNSGPDLLRLEKKFDELGLGSYDGAFPRDVTEATIVQLNELSTFARFERASNFSLKNYDIIVRRKKEGFYKSTDSADIIMSREAYEDNDNIKFLEEMMATFLAKVQ